MHIKSIIILISLKNQSAIEQKLQRSDVKMEENILNAIQNIRTICKKRIMFQIIYNSIKGKLIFYMNLNIC